MFMEIKEHLYFRLQKVTISGILYYIVRSNSLNTYVTSSSFNKPNTGDPLKKKKMAGALEEKMAGALEEKMADALEEKAVDLKKKKRRRGRETKEKDIMKRRQEGGENEKKMGTEERERRKRE